MELVEIFYLTGIVAFSLFSLLVLVLILMLLRLKREIEAKYNEVADSVKQIKRMKVLAEIGVLKFLMNLVGGGDSNGKKE